MKKFFIFFIILLSPLILYAFNCTTSKCHNDIKKLEFAHGPVAAEQCTVCHVASNIEIKKHIDRPKSFIDFKSPTGDDPVCIMCHDNKMNGKYVHAPVNTGDCTACHNPHGGTNKYFIKSKNESKTCFECHENNKTVKKYLHGPVAAGECSSCHDPHSSDYKFQLKADKDKLCFMCHSDKKEGFKKVVVHQPVKDGCTKCHDPHNSDTKFHLRAKSEKELCLSCHKKDKNLFHLINNAKYKHKPVSDGNCGDCHNPHSSDFGKLLLSDTKNICFDCHDDIGEKVKNSKYVHGPVKTDGCTACHDVHGAKFPFILKMAFPKKFYNPYKKGLYDLCFNCHNEQILQFASTTKYTGFRNGDKNLHYLHVRIKGKGRSCKACHEVHASNQPKHVRKSVPFGSGGWELPINFTKTKTGGSCVVGCHKPKSYDRVHPVKNN
ncbi:multiheme c-type cytochrome [Deferribacter desulfuricans SSM1]|uniref:Multiheme c-type cytochrome n=1 Tax=Deferribacter desulfuricans (strain DSM 14783 / JCM 11476 / NBRC 101012 / SSM1) TaxID=639282 RepID=D3PCA3_DEFDS|nr:cytochrome c3 family protein [Deferribacter desulfuricans]BAI80226.1 multiheme c-type cytochrome [Deferribacter desulfuricans SSM1]